MAKTKSTGLGQFVRRNAPAAEPPPAAEPEVAQSARAAAAAPARATAASRASAPMPAPRKRGQGATVALSVRVSRPDWERLHQLAVSESISLQELIVRGLSREFEAKGLPGIGN